LGLSNVVSGGIILIVLVLAIMTMPKLLDSTISLQDASTRISHVEDVISKTSISLDTLVAPTTNKNEITFSVNNVGEEKLWNFAKFNVITTYYNSTNQYTQSLTYAGTCGGQPAKGKWCINSISNDILDPDILNYGEILNVKSSVTNNINSGTLIVVVGTDNGITATISTSVP